MLGVARQAAIAHQAATNHYKDKPLGILTTVECNQLIEIVDRLQDEESRLYQFCRIRIDLEQKMERSRELVAKSGALDIADEVLQQVNQHEALEADQLPKVPATSKITNTRSLRDEESMTALTVASNKLGRQRDKNKRNDGLKQGQVLDVKQALTEVNKEQSLQEHELLRQTMKLMEPILKHVPNLKLYAESNKLFPNDDYFQ